MTHRPLLAVGERQGERSPLTLGGSVVGCWLRTRSAARPLAVHPGWRIDPDNTVAVIMSGTGQRRTPETLRRERQLARLPRGSRRLACSGL